jgi:hypothetical protein
LKISHLENGLVTPCDTLLGIERGEKHQGGVTGVTKKRGGVTTLKIKVFENQSFIQGVTPVTPVTPFFWEIYFLHPLSCSPSPLIGKKKG